MDDENLTFKNDHDVLVTLVVEVRQLRNELKEMKDSSIARLERLEVSTVKGQELVAFKTEILAMSDDHEQRLRFIERYLWGALGVLAVIQFIGFAYLFTVFKS